MWLEQTWEQPAEGEAVTLERMSIEQTCEQLAQDRVVAVEWMSIEQVWEQPAEGEAVTLGVMSSRGTWEQPPKQPVVTLEGISHEQVWEQAAEEQAVAVERMSTEQNWEQPAEEQAVTLERMSSQHWEQPPEEQTVTLENMLLERTREQPAGEQVVATLPDPITTNDQLINLEKCRALAPTGNTTEIQCMMDLFEALGGEIDEHWYAALVCACAASSPPNQSAAERAFYDMAARGLRVERVRSLFTRVVGQSRYAQLLQTLWLQGEDLKTLSTSSTVRRRAGTPATPFRKQAHFAPVLLSGGVGTRGPTASRQRASLTVETDARATMANPSASMTLLRRRPDDHSEHTAQSTLRGRLHAG